MLKTANFKNFGPLIFISIFEFVIFAIQAPFDLEPLHDGLAFAMATATANDLLPNRDFFAQYGPLSPFIFGSVLKVFGHYMLVLRIFTAILLTVTGCIFFLILKRFISVKSACLLSITWAVSSPLYINLNTDLPWASVVTTLFSISILYLLALIKDKNLHFRSMKLCIFLISLILILSVLTRPQLLLTILFISFLFIFDKKNTELLEIRKLMISSLVSISVLLGILLVKLGIALPWFEQSFLWPVKEYLLSRTAVDKSKLVDLSLYLLFPLYFFLYKIFEFYFKKTPKFYILFLLGLPSIILITFIQNIEVEHKSFLNYRYLIVYFCQNIFLIFGYSAAIAILVQMFKLLFKPETSYYEKFSIIIGLSALLQLYPIHDQLHLWWLTPVLIASVASKLNTMEKYFLNSVVSRFQLLSSLLILGSLINIFIYVNSSRIAYESKLLSGMRGDEISVNVIDSTLIALNSLPTNSKIGFDCRASFYSVFDGTFNPELRKVGENWEPTNNMALDMNSYDYIFVCWLQNENDKIKIYDNQGSLVFRVDFGNGLSNRIYRNKIT